MGLVEREQASLMLGRLLEKCTRKRQGEVVVVSGGLALGKTALLEGFAEHANSRGALVLTAAGSRAETDLQLGVIEQLFHSTELPDCTAERVSDLVRVSVSPAQADEHTIPELSDATGVHGICAILLELARTQPVVIGIDDVPFMDAASFQVLQSLLRRIRKAPILVVLNEWVQIQTPRQGLHAAMVRHSHHRIKLSTLSQDGVAQMAAQVVGDTTAARLAPHIHQETGGNPLLVRALLDDAAAESEDIATIAPRGLPGTAFGQAVLGCLHRWEPGLQTIAEGVAVLHDRSSPVMLNRLLGVNTEEAIKAMQVLDAAGLLDGHRFRSATARTAVLDSMTPEHRCELNLQVAALLDTCGVPSTEVAGHLLAAGQVSGTWAAEVLRDAARHAIAEDQSDRAVTLLQLALSAGADDQVQTAIRMMLARAEWRDSPSVAAHHLPQLQAAVRDGTLTDDDAVTVVRQLLWQGSPDAVDLMDQVIEQASGSAASRVTAELQLAYNFIYGSFRRPSEGEPSGGARLRLVTDNLWAEAAATLAAALSSGEAERVASSAEHMLQSCRLRDDTLEVAASGLLALLYAGRTARAATWCDTLADEASLRRSNTWEALFCGIRAEIALRQGELATAAAGAQKALDMLPANGWGVLIGMPLATLLQAQAAMGHTSWVNAPEKHVVPEAMFQTVFGLRYLQARGHYYLAADHPLVAAHDFEHCSELMKKRNLDLPSIVPWRSDLAQAQLRLGRPGVARELVAAQLERLRPDDDRVRGVCLRVLAAASDLAQRSELLHGSVDTLENTGDQFELARSLADLSHTYRELGDSDTASLVLRRSIREAGVSGAERFLGRLSPGAAEGIQETDDELDTTPSISDAERRVATLAALGHTNREISRQLYITVSTVEQHLTRVYRKLNVRGRSALPPELTRQPDPYLRPAVDRNESFQAC